ncbi:MAG: hypothetical protein ACXVCF_22980 [Isosphaeraceae bacterium]
MKWARAVEKLHRRQGELLKERSAPRAERSTVLLSQTGWPDVA